MHSLPEKANSGVKCRFLPEKANSGVKCRFEDPLRKGLDARKVTKTRLKLVGHDVRIIGYLGIMEGIKTHWFRG
jgi:hypothetical protein